MQEIRNYFCYNDTLTIVVFEQGISQKKGAPPEAPFLTKKTDS